MTRLDGHPGRHRWRVVAACALGMMVLQVGWILAVPPYFGIDEIDHAYRASSVAAGHWGTGGVRSAPGVDHGELIAVRKDVPAAAHDACRQFRYLGPANCSPVGAAQAPGEVLIASSAARYNPTFYVLVDVVAGHARGYANLYLMRAAAALLCTLVLAAGVWSTLVWSRSRWPRAMFLLAVTPETLYSSTVAAPNGLEMISGLTLCSALLGLFATGTAPIGAQRRGLLAVAVVSGSLLVSVHTLGVLWLGLIGLLVLVVAGPGRVLGRVQAAPRGHLGAALLLAIAVVASLAWVLAAGANRTSGAGTPTVSGSAWPQVLMGLPLWPLQAIATFPSRDEPAPPVVYAIVIGLMLAALVRAAPGLRGRLGAGALLLVVVSYALPLALTTLTYHQLGYAWQGRYGMPFAAGLFLLLGLAAERRHPVPGLGPRIVGAAALLTAVAQALAEHHLVQRQLTLALWRDNPHWDVPGPLLLGSLAVVGAGLWAVALLATPVAAPVRHGSSEARDPIPAG